MRILFIGDNQNLIFEIRAIIERKKLNRKYQIEFANSQVIDVSRSIHFLVNTFDLIFSAHCVQVFPEELVKSVKCINLHPGLNPHNRGWYSHAFSLENGLPIGVTIHEMDEKIDHGPIIVQEKVEVAYTDNVRILARKLFDLELDLFERSIKMILEGKYKTFMPEEGNYNSKEDYEKLKAKIKVTVALLYWKRAENFDKILKSWLTQDEVNQVIIWDNSGNFRTDHENVLVISASQNLNSRWRFLLAQLSKNDLIILADDDVLVEKGIVKDFLKYFSRDKVVGIMGRNFTNETYYTSPIIYAGEIQTPTQIDYLCSNCILTHRNNCLNIDYRKLPTDLMDDWWWEHQLLERGVSCWVIPTEKAHLLPEGDYPLAQHLDPKMKKIREYYFRKWVKK